jgi:hypothetical protein
MGWQVLKTRKSDMTAIQIPGLGPIKPRVEIQQALPLLAKFVI